MPGTAATKQRYTAPIRVPESQTGPLTLTFWAQDTAGNRAPPRRAHYVLAPAVPHLEYLGIDRTVLGLEETATLRWRSTAVGATYALAVTQSGWGPGRLLAHGTVTSEGEQHTPITGKALRPGENRLWLRVQDAAGAEAATALELTVHATPATTRAWPAGGVFGRPQQVTLFTERPATIYFTTDGSLPTLASPRYTTPLRIERDTVLHYFSVDAYGNHATPHQERYEIHPQAPTIALQTLSGDVVGGETPVVFTWRSDMAGRYEVVLVHGHEPRQVVVQQGTVQRQQAVRSTIAPDFVTAGAWRAQVRVQPEAGKAGVVSFWLRAHYLETFAETRYLDTQSTTAVWDTAQRHVRLTRGPRLLATYQTRAHSRRVTGHGPYAYLANGKGGLHIVDVSNPHAPRRAGVFDPHGVAVALAKHGQFVYVAASDSGLAVFDVTDPAVPRLVAMVPLPGVTTDIAIAAPYAYVGTQQGVLYILDLTTPLAAAPAWRSGGGGAHCRYCRWRRCGLPGVSRPGCGHRRGAHPAAATPAAALAHGRGGHCSRRAWATGLRGGWSARSARRAAPRGAGAPEATALAWRLWGDPVAPVCAVSPPAPMGCRSCRWTATGKCIRAP